MREVIFHFVHSYLLALLAYCPARIAFTAALDSSRVRLIKKTVVAAAVSVYGIRSVQTTPDRNFRLAGHYKF